jgi:tellurite resistance protein TehA-like permease
MIARFCDWLSATSLSIAFQETSWFVPLVQTVHILAIAIILSAVAMLSFRLIVTSADTFEQGLSTDWVPWVWSALVVLLITGVLLTITEPSRELLNLVFRIKMLLVLVLAGILMIVQVRVRSDRRYWTASAARQRAARVIGVLCLILGASLVTAGRWIAYS